jgi:hypothetical protein
MRHLFMLATMICVSNIVSASEQMKTITFDMIDVEIEQRDNIEYLVTVAMMEGGDLQIKYYEAFHARDGGFDVEIPYVLADGSIATLLHIHRIDQKYIGEYSVINGSGTYAGAQGYGDFSTLTGFEGASNPSGKFRARLYLNVQRFHDSAQLVAVDN